MAKSKRAKKSSAWADRQNRDEFVQKARKQGYRARAAFKLEQIDKKYRLIRSNCVVVDLGSSPGSWSQYVADKVGSTGEIFAVDLIEMPDIENVSFIHGDFTDQETVMALISELDGRQVDLVLSDMAPNITGIASADQAKCELILHSILGFCEKALRPGGTLLFKLFEGEASNTARRELKTRFDASQVIKPDASRSRSKEIYFLARAFR
ncbi:MAG: RlmE family RNA methyltransferase [Pseudomonadota bacterium]